VKEVPLARIVWGEWARVNEHGIHVAAT